MEQERLQQVLADPESATEQELSTLTPEQKKVWNDAVDKKIAELTAQRDATFQRMQKKWG